MKQKTKETEQTTRELSLEWWKGLTYTQKYNLIQEELGKNYPSTPTSLQDDDIETIYNRLNNQLQNSLSILDELDDNEHLTSHIARNLRDNQTEIMLNSFKSKMQYTEFNKDLHSKFFNKFNDDDKTRFFDNTVKEMLKSGYTKEQLRDAINHDN